jgi:hypothetical protein
VLGGLEGSRFGSVAINVSYEKVILVAVEFVILHDVPAGTVDGFSGKVRATGLEGV